MNRARPLRPLAVLVALGAVVSLASCGDDGDDGASSTTASSTTATSTTTTSTTGKATTTTGGGSAPGDGTIDLTIGTKKVTLTLQACTSEAETSVELTAEDASGNTLTVTAADGSGSIVYRGASEDREGQARSVTVGDDGTLDISGIMSIADDSAPGPDDVTITGLCTP